MFTQNSQAQLGFCSGNSGDPIFMETFGTGGTTPLLPPGTTSYTYRSTAPDDGFYNVSSNTNWFGWHNIVDHTIDDANGRMLVVNAEFTSGEFYRTTINGLCEATTYEFSSWLINLLPSSLCGGSGIPVNVNFEITDLTGLVLASGDTGNIFGSEQLAINMSVYIDGLETEFLPHNCNWLVSNLLPKFNEKEKSFVDKKQNMKKVLDLAMASVMK